MDLVEEGDKITHNISIDDDLDTEDMLNFFKIDENFADKEAQWDEIKKEIVGDYFDQPLEEENQSAEDSAEVSNFPPLNILC